MQKKLLLHRQNDENWASDNSGSEFSLIGNGIANVELKKINPFLKELNEKKFLSTQINAITLLYKKLREYLTRKIAR